MCIINISTSPANFISNSNSPLSLYSNDILLSSDGVLFLNSSVSSLIASLKKEKALNDNLTSIALSSINKLGSNLAKSFADIITGVKGAGFGELFKSILSTLGEFITQMGAAVMAYAVTMEAFKHAFSDPYIAIAAGFGLMVMGGIVSNLANSIGGKSKGFASGGIVGGSAFEGDNVHVRVNSGEMILNKNQQSTLFALANGAKPSGDIPAFKVDFKILGNNLVGVLNNHNNRLKNIR